MLVPAVVAASVSPVKNVPPLIDTVAEASVVLSTSLTVAPDDSVTAAACSVYDAVGATLLSTGALSTAVMLIVLLAGALLAVPLFTTQLTVRLASVPKSVGFWLLEEKVTDSSAVWYCATVAIPFSVSSPVAAL